MPYIGKERSELIMQGDWPNNAGELNYCFTRAIIHYMKSRGVSYQTMNDVVGALENAKNEFQRRIVHPYEDSKIAKNGDVY